VTGCAGFIASHLCERLVDEGHEVTGVDCFTDAYERATKERNLAELRRDARFELRELDLARDALGGLLDGVDAVYHLAGRAGVRESFGPGRSAYVRENVRATRRLLEQAARTPVRRFVYASSSSVYGDAAASPTPEGAARAPLSPYAMTKVAVEDLAARFHERHGVAVVGLRYFTVYGPRQRPDMAFHRFLDAGLAGVPVTVHGDGTQRRDFTYVCDAVELTVAAARRGRPGTTYNGGGGAPVAVLDALATIERLLDRPLRVELLPSARGDARCTAADTELAERELDAVPATPLEDGLAAQLEWMRAVVAARASRRAARAG
jgi:nucleoside-diphosphate-sugar epimerase